MRLAADPRPTGVLTGSSRASDARRSVDFEGVPSSLDDLLQDAVREHVCLRQPIVDARRRVLGYEVFVAGPPQPGDTATSARLLLQAFTGLDLDLLAGPRPAYVDVAPALLALLDVLPVAPDRVVLQLDASRPLTDVVREAVARHARLGYVFAATGITTPAQLEHLPEASLVRLDVSGHGPDAVTELLARFAGTGVAIHATGVDDLVAYDACTAAGCEGFQGSFWTLPSSDEAGADLGALSSAADLLDPDADLDRLEVLVSRDLALTYGIMRYANSAFFARRTEIGTVRQACMTLGERMTRRWALIVALSAATGDGDPALMGDALLRARTLENVARDLPGLNADVAFTVGLLSLTPGLVGAPMGAIVAGLSLPAVVADALVGGAPPYGTLLRRTVAFIDGDDLSQGSARIALAYEDALAWVRDVLPSLMAQTATA